MLCWWSSWYNGNWNLNGFVIREIEVVWFGGGWTGENWGNGEKSLCWDCRTLRDV